MNDVTIAEEPLTALNNERQTVSMTEMQRASNKASIRELFNIV